jgi:hypothetical protein
MAAASQEGASALAAQQLGGVSSTVLVDASARTVPGPWQHVPPAAWNDGVRRPTRINQVNVRRIRGAMRMSCLSIR